MGLLLNIFIISTFVAVLNCAPAEDASTTLATTNKAPVLATTQEKIKDTSASKESQESQESQEDRKTRDVQSQAPIRQKPILPQTEAKIDTSSSTEDDKSKEQKPVIQPLVGGRQRRDTPKIQIPGSQKTRDNPKIVPAPAPVAARPSRDVQQKPDSQKTKDNPKIQTLPAKIQRPARDTPKTKDNPKIQTLPLPVKKN